MEKYAIVAGTEKAVGSVIIRKVRRGIFWLEGYPSIVCFYPKMIPRAAKHGNSCG
jgi:hypothetical protein